MAYIRGGDLSQRDSTKLEELNIQKEMWDKTLLTIIQIAKDERADVLATLDYMVKDSSSYQKPEQYTSLIDSITAFQEDSKLSLFASPSSNMLLDLQKESAIRGKDNLDTYNTISAGVQTTAVELNKLLDKWSSDDASALLENFQAIGQEAKEKGDLKTQKYYNEEVQNLQHMLSLAEDIMWYDNDPNTEGLQHHDAVIRNAYEALQRLDVDLSQRNFDRAEEGLSNEAWKRYQSDYSRYVTQTNTSAGKVHKDHELYSRIKDIPAKLAQNLGRSQDSIDSERQRIHTLMANLLHGSKMDDTLQAEYDDRGIKGIEGWIKSKLVPTGQDYKNVFPNRIRSLIDEAIDFKGWGIKEEHKSDKAIDPLFVDLVLLLRSLDQAETYHSRTSYGGI